MDISSFAAEGLSLLEKTAEMPPEADFCLTVADNSMEPYINAGDIVYITTKKRLEEFDVGVFYYGGKVCCRQWCEDYSGALLLLGSNGAENTISVSRKQRQHCYCLGKVLLDEKPPRPKNF